ncbi:DUF6364 family protein [Chitinophaga japonensis]|uniref:Antitoxin n=1 Tax=Chitinophaga japonensis TaxID=104662 RepID=A0A562T2J2_CHIJA|nr:DUF6364 family protein [Chitinophaga japonensis]TWI87869.1 hypothetical protein LX66_1943 [Chitinophaga japonensis]
MKTRLNLTIEENLLQRMKMYAARQHVSLSELVESYFERLTQPVKRKSIVDIVERMDTPVLPPETDLVSEYYKDIEREHGL